MCPIADHPKAETYAIMHAWLKEWLSLWQLVTYDLLRYIPQIKHEKEKEKVENENKIKNKTWFKKTRQKPAWFTKLDLPHKKRRRKQVDIPSNLSWLFNRTWSKPFFKIKKKEKNKLSATNMVYVDVFRGLYWSRSDQTVKQLMEGK